jgi:hypothetical protein
VRTVSANISKLGLNIGDTIKVQLLNSIGKPALSSDGYFYDKDISIDSDILSLTLKENDTIHTKTFYKITTQAGFEFSFEILTSLLEDNPTHDLISLLYIGCFENIVYIKNNEKLLSDSFLQKLESYFTGENPHFTNAEKSLIDLYEYYADEVIGTDTTIDIIQMMDEYLATLGV